MPVSSMEASKTPTQRLRLTKKAKVAKPARKKVRISTAKQKRY